MANAIALLIIHAMHSELRQDQATDDAVHDEMRRVLSCALTGEWAAVDRILEDSHDAAVCRNRDWLECLLEHAPGSPDAVARVLHGALSNGCLHLVPEAYRHPDVLLAPDAEGNTILHAACGCEWQLDEDDEGHHFAALPAALITEENLMARNASGWTVLHRAAAAGCLHAIPERFLTRRNLLTETPQGLRVIDLAAVSGQLPVLPAGLLDEAMLLSADPQGRTTIHHAARGGRLHQIPARFLTHDTLLTATGDGETVVHLAAEGGCVDQLPAFALEDAVLRLARTTDGSTAFHLAARQGCLDALPAEAITGDALELTDAAGRTVVHAAAEGRCLDQIRGALTEAPLLARDRRGLTPLHLAAERDCLGQIPPQLLTPSHLLVRDAMQRTPLHLANLLRVPPALLTPHLVAATDALGRNVLHAAAEKPRDGILPLHAALPPSLLTRELLLARDHAGRTPLHALARQGSIHLLPRECTGPDALGLQDDAGRSVLHELALAGRLDSLPPRLLPPELLVRADRAGRTPLHCAASTGSLSGIRFEILGDSDLLIADLKGDTILHAAARHGCLRDIPDHFLFAEDLLLKNDAGRSVAEEAILHGHVGQIRRTAWIEFECLARECDADEARILALRRILSSRPAIQSIPSTHLIQPQGSLFAESPPLQPAPAPMFRCVDLEPLASGCLLLHSMPGQCEALIDFQAGARQEGIDRMIVLTSDREIVRKSPGYLAWLVDNPLGIEISRFPIPDYSAPDDVGVFLALVASIVRDLRAGRTVLVHCGAGVGRTGTMAVCLLRELGFDAFEAIVRVEDAHSEPETDEQKAMIDELYPD